MMSLKSKKINCNNTSYDDMEDDVLETSDIVSITTEGNFERCIDLMLHGKKSLEQTRNELVEANRGVMNPFKIMKVNKVIKNIEHTREIYGDIYNHLKYGVHTKNTFTIGH